MPDRIQAPDREYVELATDLAERFAKRADRFDRENRFPHENFEELRESGYLAMTVPRELGGGGVGLPGLCRAQEALAQGCGATALSSNMHLFTIGVAGELWREVGHPTAEPFLRSVVQGETLVATTASEIETGGNNLRQAAARARPCEGGYRVSGRKIFCSLSPAMSGLITHAGIEGSQPPELAHFLVPRDAPGVQVCDDWDAMGMRGTGSNDVVLEDVFVPDALVLMVRPAGRLDRFEIKSHRWFSLTFGSIYTGIALAALQEARRVVTRRIRKPATRPISHTPHVQFLVGEMEALIASSRALVEAEAERLGPDDDDDPTTLARVSAAKLLATENAVAVVDMALTATGGSSYLKSSPLERLYRDVRAGKVHPPTRYNALEVIGKVSLGIDLTAEPRWD